MASGRKERINEIAATLAKRTPEERKGWPDGLQSTTMPDSRREMLARITHSAHK